MNKEHVDFEVIIIGGSYAGLSAALSLGRALRDVLLIDGGKPCNLQTPYSHNFLTHDGVSPLKIIEKGREEIIRYKTVKFYNGFAVNAFQEKERFGIRTQSGDVFSCRKLILATGLIDIMPEIKGFAECWGISILHCPYCHGYEAKDLKTGILANGDAAFESVKMVCNWTHNLTLFTDGKSTLTTAQAGKLEKYKVKIVEEEIDFIEHTNGQIENIVFKNQEKISLEALYAHPAFVQSSDIPEKLGCEITEKGCISVDLFQKTTVSGVFACGDNSTLGRSIAVAVHGGSIAGIFANKEIIENEF